VKPDRGRTAVYAAEVAAFAGTDLEDVLAVEAIVDLGARLIASRWWPGPRVVVRPARADASSSHCTWRDGATTITIASPQATVATLAHELAHALAGVPAGHGPAFRRALLDVVATVTNLASLDIAPVAEAPDLGRRGVLHVDQLAAGFVAAGLEVGDRTWPAPPDVAGPIAL
jgi:hypothetical protein